MMLCRYVTKVCVLESCMLLPVSRSESLSRQFSTSALPFFLQILSSKVWFKKKLKLFSINLFTSERISCKINFRSKRILSCWVVASVCPSHWGRSCQLAGYRCDTILAKMQGRILTKQTSGELNSVLLKIKLLRILMFGFSKDYNFAGLGKFVEISGFCCIYLLFVFFFAK